AVTQAGALRFDDHPAAALEPIDNAGDELGAAGRPRELDTIWAKATRIGARVFVKQVVGNALVGAGHEAAVHGGERTQVDLAAEAADDIETEAVIDRGGNRAAQKRQPAVAPGAQRIQELLDVAQNDGWTAGRHGVR